MQHKLSVATALALSLAACGPDPGAADPADEAFDEALDGAEASQDEAALEVPSTVPIFIDSMQSGFQDWSWAVHNLASTSPVHGGTRAVSFEPDRWSALYFQKAGFSVSGLSSIDFFVRGGTVGGQRIQLRLVRNNNPVGTAVIISTRMASGRVRAGIWDKVSVPMSALGITSGTIDGLFLQDASGTDQGRVHVDDMVAVLKATTTVPPPTVDAGTPPPTTTPPPPTTTPPPPTTTPPPPPPATGATLPLHTEGNRIRRSDGSIWAGRGANVHDTRSCNACSSSAPNVGEVKRRIDELVDVWKATFIRFDMESNSSANTVLNNPGYLADVVEIVDHVKTKPGVYIMLSLWIDPFHSSIGWPTAGTANTWRELAEVFRFDDHVLYGLVNEPQNNYDGALDAQVWTAMNDTVAAIRDVERQFGVPQHVVAVQGTGGWARFLGYYVNHPITAGGGTNIAYETHVYDSQSAFSSRFGSPSTTLPVIIGEFGPANGMSMSDCSELIRQAKQLQIPFAAWTFHMRCPPNLLVDNSNAGCGVGMPLQPTAWGTLLKNALP